MFAKLFVLTLAACVMATAVSAKIWRVDSDPTNAADFRTLQEAHDGANSGDTLYVRGSSSNYGDLEMEGKKLAIIGPGYFLGENDSTQASPLPATMDNLDLYSGVSGSLITGLTMWRVYFYDARAEGMTSAPWA